jgi:murein DD-endopeptidase MepM/ murein hydrolase activator NlpD
MLAIGAATACVLGAALPAGSVAQPIGINSRTPFLAENPSGEAFPLAGPYEAGDGFGAGRGHQGVDLLAECGIPVLAARSGVVQWSESGGAGGNMLVIDSDGDGSDLAYMHFQEVYAGEGDHVEAGEQLGLVGDTGSASTCHLHFEHWSAPGWYEGGVALDPAPLLARLKR